MSRNRMLVISVVAAILTVVLIVFVVRSNEPQEATAAPPGPKVTICHKTGPTFGYGPDAVTITVGERAVPAHLAHGDTLGPCP